MEHGMSRTPVRSDQAAAAVLELAGRLIATPSPNLPGDERAVAELVAEGLSSAEIAERLYVAHRTVGYHLTNIFAKLGVANRAEAVAWAVRNGLA